MQSLSISDLLNELFMSELEKSCIKLTSSRKLTNKCSYSCTISNSIHSPFYKLCMVTKRSHASSCLQLEGR